MTGRAGTRSFSTIGFSLRNLRSIRGGLIVLGLVVALATAGVVGWPRLTADLLNSDLAYRTTSASASVRNLQSSVEAATNATVDQFGFATETLDPTWSGMPDALARARASMGGTLRSITLPGRFVGRDDGPGGAGVPASGAPHAPVASVFNLFVEANPQLAGDAKLVRGSWPGKSGHLPSDTALQVVTTKDAAKTLGWRVGETQQLTLAPNLTQTVELSGLVEPRNPNSDYWQLDLTRAEASFTPTPDGDLKSYRALVWMNADSFTTIGLDLPGEGVRSWFPVSASHLRVGELPDLSAQLQKFLATPDIAGNGQPPTELRFGTQLAGVLDDFTARAAPANALLAVIGTGPLGTGLAVLLLGVILLVDRRRTALALMQSRGGTRRRIRLTIAAETAIASVPAAVFGAAVGILLTAGSVTLPTILSAIACAVVPPVAAAARVNAPAEAPSRSGRPARGRWRWIVEILLVGLAALAIALLVGRGLSPSGSQAIGADPLVTLTPLLVAAGSCVAILRFFPFALEWIGTLLRRRRGVVGYVGWATSARARPRFLPVFAVVAGVSVAIFSLSVLSTERDGIQDAALTQIGADISVTGAPITAATAAKIRALPQVEHSATIVSAGGISLTGVSDAISLFTVNGGDLAAVQSSLPPALRLYSSLGTMTDGRVSAVAGGFQQKPPINSSIETRTPIRVHIENPQNAPSKFVSNPPWLIVDSADIPASAQLPHRDAALLLSLRPGTNATAVSHEIADLARRGTIGSILSTANGGSAVVTSTPTVVAGLRAAPLVYGLEDMTVAAVLLSALMCVIALILTLVMNTDARTRLLARLRVLGFTRRQSSGLIAWELGPMALLGIVAGMIVGVALPVVILGAVNLAGFVGSTVRPLLVIDPLLVGATVIVFAIAAAVATTIAIAIARRTAPATIIRATGED
ncbi:MAG TPA: FtsX-like permease family protein [Galbitalea sp.]|jgi:putative ABC transport system permease protein